MLAIVALGHRAKPASSRGDVDLIIHGTTLATNAVIERKGAKTALLTTEGFRDVVEIRHENRFEQYDVNIDLPPPLVPRRLRLPVRERIDAQGDVLVPLDDDERRARDRHARRADRSRRSRSAFCTASPIPDHERRVGEAIARRLPDVAVTLSSDVSPEMREYERFSTACANAYIQPLMGRYLTELERELDARRLSLSAAADDLGRRHHHGRDRDPLSGAADRIRAGRRRDLRRLHRAAARPRSGRVVRHGRHHGENLLHRQGAAADRARCSKWRASTASSKAAACRCAFR